MSLVSSYGTQTLGAAAGAGSAASTAADAASSSLLTTLFGAHKAAIEGKIAQASGLSSGTGAPILASAAPLVLSALLSKMSGGAAGLASALTIELPGLRSLIPAGLPGSASSARAESEKVGGGWLWPVLLLGALLIGALVWYFNRGAGTADVTKPAEAVVAATQTAAADAGTAISDATKAVWAKLGDMINLKLPDGTELNVPQLGVESKLVKWIESSSPVDTATWFDFDRLLFASDSATLEPVSHEQLSNVAAILKAFPKVKVKLGGYTDNTGDPTANLKLSDDRAKNVMAELVKLGVDPSRMEAQGYGDEHPVGDNNSEEGRQLNRRISLRVTEK
jgi:outer membrane protein OmpA-like peptidoglycan-associated protein